MILFFPLPLSFRAVVDLATKKRGIRFDREALSLSLSLSLASSCCRTSFCFSLLFYVDLTLQLMLRFRPFVAFVAFDRA